MMDNYFVTDVPRSSKKVIKKALVLTRRAQFVVCTSFCASA